MDDNALPAGFIKATACMARKKKTYPVTNVSSGTAALSPIFV
jgi:hypothetical protein